MIPKRDLKFHFYRSSGPGGQRKNKVETAVRVTHLPTGITASATESRSQAQNRALALERLQEKLRKRSLRKKPRIKTAAPAAAAERRLLGKKLTARKKQVRKTITRDERE